MRGDPSYNLTFHFGRIEGPPRREPYRQLLKRVLDVDIPDARGSDDPWYSFSLFVDGRVCVANIDAAILPLILEGTETATIGLRSVAVDDAWRGRGLFRDLMAKCLDWVDAQGPILALLFTEEPELYERYGFRHVPQHAFVGRCPAPSPGRVTSRRLDPKTPDDREIIRTLVAQRAPISLQCALEIDPDQTLMNLTKDDAYAVNLIDELETLVVYGFENETLVLADIVSRNAPDLDKIVTAIGQSPQDLKVLFPPDRLGWSGAAMLDETGLMIRGTLPPALQRPFMIPPTAEF